MAICQMEYHHIVFRLTAISRRRLSNAMWAFWSWSRTASFSCFTASSSDNKTAISLLPPFFPDVNPSFRLAINLSLLCKRQEHYQSYWNAGWQIFKLKFNTHHISNKYCQTNGGLARLCATTNLSKTTTKAKFNWHPMKIMCQCQPTMSHISKSIV